MIISLKEDRSRGGQHHFFSGLLDDVRVYDRAIVP